MAIELIDRIELPRHAGSRREITEAVLSEVRAVVSRDLAASLSADSSLFELGLDSIAFMDVVNRIEKHFGLRFREEWLYDLETCADVVSCIVRQVGARDETQASPASAAPPIGPNDAMYLPATDGLPATDPIPQDHYDVSLFPECLAFAQRLQVVATAGLANPFFRTYHRVHDRMAALDDGEVVSYTSFDYLGLAGHPGVIHNAKAAIDQFGCSASASRLVGGNLSIMEELDAELAQFLGAESAIVFPSGYGTNASLFGHLFGEQDLILYDELAHNSIAQGAILSKAARRPFPHNDVGATDELLRDLRRRYRRVVIAIEGVYSMDGDFPDLPAFVELKHRHRALLYVDEAHSMGVMGKTGRGLCEHFGIDPAEGDLWMGTISKSLGSGGGYLAGRADLIRYLRYTTPSFVFATATSPANVAAALSALRTLRAEPERVARLRDRARLFLKLTQNFGMDTGNSGETPIIPIILGSSPRCIQISQELLSRGIDARPILYPAVRESAARIRFFITSEHTEEQIEYAVRTLAECLGCHV